MLNIGILLFALTLVFQIVTLPVEFNASSRALKILDKSGMLYKDEVRGARKSSYGSSNDIYNGNGIYTSSTVKTYSAVWKKR